MTTAIIVLLLAAVAGLVAVAVRQHSELVDLRTRIGDLGASAATGDEHDAIVIVIQNHDEVAARRNPLARGLSALSPMLVRNLVHREALREVRRQMEIAGVDADIRIRRVVPRAPAELPGDP